MFKSKKFKVLLSIILLIMIIVISYLVYTIYEAEKMFYKYVNNGDQWVCDKYDITLTCHVEETDTTIPDYYLTAKIEGFDKKILIQDLRGGHCKSWIWGTSTNNVNDEDICDLNLLFIGDYYVKNKNTLEFTANESEMEISDINDNTLVNMFKNEEILTFKRVPKNK